MLVSERVIARRRCATFRALERAAACAAACVQGRVGSDDSRRPGERTAASVSRGRSIGKYT